MHLSGSLNPWSPNAEKHAAPIWEDENHTTPFSALADLLQNWPGAPQTSERKKRERHNRLMQTVAGYPEISSGRRPLDDPLHFKSGLAFKLSLFLDTIPTGTPHEWHSLRSELLSRDMLEFGKISDVKCLHTLMSRIRSCTKYKKKGTKNPVMYPPNELHPDEIKFLTVLHSQDIERRNYWPLSSDGTSLEFKEFKNTESIPFCELDGSANKGKYKEHEFKFTKIKEFITDWARPGNEFHPIHPDASHNLIIGASVMLESTFAKLRSQVIAEHGVGSIIVDGGGRLTYLSTRPAEEEKNWFFEKLGAILKFDNEYLHPYQNLIQEAVEDYVSAAGSFIKQQVEEHNRRGHPKINLKELWKKNGEEKNPSRQMYDFLYRPDYVKDCFPAVSDKITKRSLEKKTSESKAKAHTKSWEYQHCLLCSPNEVEETCCGQREITIRKASDGVHEYWCQKCSKKFGNCFDTPTKAMRSDEENYVCPFHYLLYRIGKRATIRLGSRTDLFKIQPQPPKSGKQIERMIMFDGNSIGDWFTQDFDDYRAPEAEDLDKEEENFWEQNKQQIHDLWGDKKPIQKEETEKKRTLKEKVLDLGEEFESIDFDYDNFTAPEKWHMKPENVENKKRSLIKKLFLTRRLQVMIRRQRRSFHFNAVWWQTLTIALQHTFPWVIAGDDIVLVSSRASDKEVDCEMLKTFHEYLKKNFPHTAITFAGAISTRTNSIRDLYQSTNALEVEAGLFWKHLVSDHSKLPAFDKDKKKKVKDWRDNEESEISRERKRLEKHIEKFTFGDLTDSSVPSVLLHDNWEEMLD